MNINFYKGNANAVRSQLAKVIREKFDPTKIEGIKQHDDKKDFILLNPVKGKAPYLTLMLKGFNQSNRTKDSVLLDYTFEIEVYDEYKELLGSKPTITYDLIDAVLEIVYNNQGDLSNDIFRVYYVDIVKVTFDKDISPGNTRWMGLAEFTLTVGFA